MISSPLQQSRQEVFHEQTRSICPECRKLIDAWFVLRDGRVFIRKTCPEHGQFEGLFFGDADLYLRIAPYNKPGTLPLHFATQVREGCPYDCGLCPHHQQHACMAIIEVNQACNLDCPLCFAGAGTHYAHTGFELTYEQVGRMIDAYIAAEGSPEVLQFSGGEPTLHPRIIDFIELANRKGIKYVVVNTNGIRLARDDKFLDALAKTRAHINLQFDGLDSRTNELLRGRPDLFDIKLKALDRLAQADMRVVLIAAVERGVNEHELGKIVEFGLQHPAVFGVNFQPAFHTQRYPAADPLQRMTIPDVLLRLQDQTPGLLRLDDFVPVPCCMPTCSFVTYALIEGDAVTPITRILDIKYYLDYLKNRTLPSLNDDLLKTLERLWSASAKVGSDDAARDVASLMGGNHGSEKAGIAAATRAEQRCTSCHSHLPLGEHTPRDLGRHIFMINTRDFMDPWTFNLKNAMKCCVDVLTPDGRIIPFCLYNTVGYREQVAASLHSNPAE